MARIPFQKPKTIEWQILTDRYGRLVAEPFEKGYALTVGNSLRRTLLSIIPGAAVTWARVKGIKDVETPLPGVARKVPVPPPPVRTASSSDGEGEENSFVPPPVLMRGSQTTTQILPTTDEMPVTGRPASLSWPSTPPSHRRPVSRGLAGSETS